LIEKDEAAVKNNDGERSQSFAENFKREFDAINIVGVANALVATTS
jgi:uncharacterized membrane protein YesL